MMITLCLVAIFGLGMLAGIRFVQWQLSNDQTWRERYETDKHV